jgi:hypothetical protein
MRRKFTESTTINYRSQARRLWKKYLAGTANQQEIDRMRYLERNLGIKAADIPGQGRPRKYE